MLFPVRTTLPEGRASAGKHSRGGRQAFLAPLPPAGFFLCNYLILFHFFREEGISIPLYLSNRDGGTCLNRRRLLAFEDIRGELNDVLP
jgi:hypothetical protein